MNIPSIIETTHQINAVVNKKHKLAIREAGKVNRLNLTDAIKDFIEYVDGDGKRSTCPERAYSNITKMIYAPFDLNRKQMEALEVGIKPRDYFSLSELNFLQFAENSAAAVIRNGMEANLTREKIKRLIKEKSREIATFCKTMLNSLTLEAMK